MLARSPLGYVALQTEQKQSVSGLEKEDSVRKLDAGADIVQFLLPEVIVEADAGFVELDIMRLGRKTGKLTFAFQTKEKSALPGRQFEHTSGIICMQAGEETSRIKVPIYNCPRWNPTTEFGVTLFDPEGCTLGLYLKEIRIKVVDATTFPTNEFTEEVRSDDIGNINHFSLYKSFMGLFIGEDTIWWRSLITVVLDQFKNVYYYVKLVLSIYLVDTLLNFDSTEGLIMKDDRLGTAYVVAVLYVAPPLLFFFTDTIIVWLDIAGVLRRNMSRNLFTKYMNYALACQRKYTPSDMIEAVNGDIPEAVKGFTSLLDLMRLAGKFVISTVFVLRHNPAVWWVTLLVPGLMLAWAGCRTHVFVAASESSGSAVSEVDCFMQDSMSKLDLISAYGQRPQVNDIYSHKSEEFRKATLPEKRVHMTNMFVPGLLGPALTAFYIVVALEPLVNGEINLGLFLGTLNVFGSICSDFSEIFGRLMDIISTFENLTNLTQLFNNPTDFKELRKRNLMLIEHTKEGVAHRHEQRTPEIYVSGFDRLRIEVVGLSFSYGDFKVFEGVNCECDQGVICAVKAIQGRGTRTFADLLGGRVFPSRGRIFIPSHLRRLYIHSEIMIMRLSIWQNLVFGNPTRNNPHRVERIMQHFRMKRTLELCQSDCDMHKKNYDAEHTECLDALSAQHAHGSAVRPTISSPLADDSEKSHLQIAMISETEKMFICLARAFVMNPEVLILHRPFVHFHSKESNDAVKAAMKQHRDGRGFLLPEEGKMLRRPRTIFVTTDRHDIIKEVSDVHWILPAELGETCQVLSPSDMGVNVAPVDSSMASLAEQPRHQSNLQSVNAGLAGQTDLFSPRFQPNLQSINGGLLDSKASLAEQPRHQANLQSVNGGLAGQTDLFRPRFQPNLQSTNGVLDSKRRASVYGGEMGGSEALIDSNKAGLFSPHLLLDSKRRATVCGGEAWRWDI